MTGTFTQRCKALIVELGLGQADDVIGVTPLTGGVASDIAMVELPNRKICVKFALAKLKVAADWHAPVHRNAAEYAWLKVAAELRPSSAVRLFGRSQAQHGFAMEFLNGEDVYLWKTALLEEADDRGEAAEVADMIGRIHAASAQAAFDTSQFQNRDDFYALRIEPYLTYTASIHPDLGPQLNELATTLYESQQVLVHGDVSSKNILFRDNGPIVLDAECATMGDASFDPSFCLNHLVLKAAHLHRSRSRLLDGVGHFWRAYAPHVHWEPASELESRICRLLPMLMLARIDGKSPVEYLDEHTRANVRKTAIGLIRDPSQNLDDFVARLAKDLEDRNDCN